MSPKKKTSSAAKTKPTATSAKSNRLSLALIGHSKLGSSYAHTLQSFSDFDLKYISDPKTREELAKSSTSFDNVGVKTEQQILGDKSISAVIFTQHSPHTIKHACENNKAMFVLPCMPCVHSSLSNFNQIKTLIVNNKCPYHIPIQSSMHLPYNNIKNELISSLNAKGPDHASVSFIRITHAIDNYKHYWDSMNLYDLELLQWLGDSEICEVYVKRTLRSLFIQLLLKNNILCNIEITLSNSNYPKYPTVEVHTSDNKFYNLPNEKYTGAMQTQSYFAPDTQSRHLNQFVKNINNKVVGSAALLDHTFNLLSIQLAAKQSLKENRPIRVRSVATHFTCEHNNMLPFNYLDE